MKGMTNLRFGLLAGLGALPSCEGDAQRVPGLTAFTNVNVLPDQVAPDADIMLMQPEIRLLSPT